MIWWAMQLITLFVGLLCKIEHSPYAQGLFQVLDNFELGIEIAV